MRVDEMEREELTDYKGLEGIIARPQVRGGPLGTVVRRAHLPQPLYLSGFVYFQTVLVTNKVGLKTDGG